jgi:N-methylhydantoinase A
MTMQVTEQTEVAIDIGGTFTDFVFLDRATRKVTVRKVPSTPQDPASAVFDGLADQQLATYSRFVHATTIAVNAILQQRGAVTALVTTAGFRGLIDIGDTRRYTGGLFDHTWQRERPFAVPHERRFCVRERMSAKGESLGAPSVDELDHIVEQIRAADAEAVAICFLNSFANPIHEQLVQRHLRERLEGVHVMVSSDLREFREFPRFITAIFNAYVAPLMSDYVEALDRDLIERGYRHKVSWMGSAGGVQGKETVVRAPLNLLWGGVVGGVTAGAHLARISGLQDVMTLDMGGTSTDVALVKDGHPATASDRPMGAFPLAIRQVDVSSVGAGGGSIGWVDDDGVLKVGPRSSGAAPGPACYGRGGTDFTVTDANLLLGRLGARSLLAGGMEIDRAAAVAAAELLLARAPLGEAYEVAKGVLEIATTHLEGALRQVSVDRGEDPAKLGLIAFGGAGPMHGCEVAERLGIQTVIVPRFAGAFSASGLLVADERYDYVRSFIWPLMEADLDQARRLFVEMEQEARADIDASGLPGTELTFLYTLEMRYIGQAYAEEIVFETLDQVVDRDYVGEIFRAAYERRYHYHRDVEMAEIANLRLTAIGVGETPSGALDMAVSAASTNGHGAMTRKVFFDGDWAETQVVDRATLASGAQLEGPAIIEEYDSTTVVPPSWTATVDDHAEMRLERT